MRRVDGQVWIDRKAPYRLKYHYDGIDYTVEVSATYSPGFQSFEEGGEGINMPAGSVVKLKEGTEKIIDKAVFPDDLNNILGVTINDAIGGDPDKGVAAIAQAGYIILSSKEAIKKVFPLETDRNIHKNMWGDPTPKSQKPGSGAPIYWFIGGTFRQEGPEPKKEVTYSYVDSSTHPGCMTFRTPSGYKWNVKKVEDSTMNIGYDNLPILGTVVDYKYDSTGELTELNIHLNFSKFDSSVEWNWPYLHEPESPEVEGCGLLAEGIHNFRHGLFADNRYYSELSSYITVMASGTLDEAVDPYYPEDGFVEGTNNIVNVVNKNIIKDIRGKSDRRTIIELNTPDKMLYRISGEVHYKFDKQDPKIRVMGTMALNGSPIIPEATPEKDEGQVQ